MPVASIMTEFSDAMVGMACGRVASATARIMTTGPIATTRSIFSPRSMRDLSASVTNPFRP
jgi:hypothetical protein